MAGLQVGILALSVLIVMVACISGGSADVSFQEQLLVRIEALEKQGHDQAESQEKTISEYKERVKNLEQTVADLVIERKSDVSNNLDSMKGGQPGIIKHQLGKDVTRQRRILMDGVSPVAFNANIMASADVDHLGIGQKIVFPDVTTNLGVGYHSRTGVFIAPRAGVYLFSASLTSTFPTHPSIGATIVHNGNDLGSLYANSGTTNDQEQGSKTVVTQMAAGDEVWVSVDEADASLWGGGLSGFMGCLIVPL